MQALTRPDRRVHSPLVIERGNIHVTRLLSAALILATGPCTALVPWVSGRTSQSRNDLTPVKPLRKIWPELRRGAASILNRFPGKGLAPLLCFVRCAEGVALSRDAPRSRRPRSTTDAGLILAGSAGGTFSARKYIWGRL